MTDQGPKVKGVVDIVFLVDVTGSMQPCIDALKTNIGGFIDQLVSPTGNEASPVRDWRSRVVGYRDVEADGNAWFIDNPFVRDAALLKAQLASLEAAGGGDIPESLLDALYKVSTCGQTDKNAPEDPLRWRYRSTAGRVVVIFTDAPFKPNMAIPEARGGGFQDIQNAVQSNRIILSIFAPDLACYNELGSLDKAEYIAVPGDSGLASFTGDRSNFQETLRQLAASVSKSAETIAL